MIAARLILLFHFFVAPLVAHAQWAVYDHRVNSELQRINGIQGLNVDYTRLDGHFLNQRGGTGNQDQLWGREGESRATLRSLETPFEALELSEDDRQRFIGTAQDCGDEQLNRQHFNACAGLRNLRLQTLKQSQELLVTLDRRRAQIVSLIRAAQQLESGGSSIGGGGSSVGGGSGIGGGSSAGGSQQPGAGRLQRYQFELQAQQALMQADAMQLQVLMDGYKQREKMYEVQMAEARRNTDSGRTGTAGSRPQAVPFPTGIRLFNAARN